MLPSCSSWCRLWISGNRNGASLGLLLGDSEGDEATVGCLTAGRYRTGCTAWTVGRMFDCCKVYCLEVPNGDHTLLRRSERITAGLLGEYDRALKVYCWQTEPHSTATMVQGSIWTMDCCATAMESDSVSLLLGDTDKGRRMKPHSTNDGLLDHCDGLGWVSS